MDKTLHIVTHDVPWPVDHGGYFDLFYKIRSLHKLGVKIILHCFTGSRSPQPILSDYCLAVYYYPRKENLAGFSFRLPYIVSSRNDAQLLRNLSSDHHPILLEGIHCTYFISDARLENRKIFVRLHNVESNYYQQLANWERNPIKKLYYKWESRLLRGYEKRISQKHVFLAVSEADRDFFKGNFGADCRLLPVFLPWQACSSLSGKGDYCLYHGNLAVNENGKAAEWLVKEIFAKNNLPLVVAGRAPSGRLKALVKQYRNVKLVADPLSEEMAGLIAHAQVHVLPSFNNTGIKLKLLHALFTGRHCIANMQALAGSGVESLCFLARDDAAFISETKRLFEIGLTPAEIEKRNKVLQTEFNNDEHARQLIAWIY